MTENIRELLSTLKAEITKIYGKRLRDVYLFGSYARDEQDSESDVDVMIVLSNFDSYSAELEQTGEIISKLSLKYDVSISRVIVKEGDWLTSDTPLLRNIREEAIAA